MLLKVMAVSPLLLALVPWRPTRLGRSVRQGVATLLLGTILARWALAMARQTLVHRHARHQLQPVPSDRPAQERLCSAGVWTAISRIAAKSWTCTPARAKISTKLLRELHVKIVCLQCAHCLSSPRRCWRRPRSHHRGNTCISPFVSTLPYREATSNMTDNVQ